MKRQSLLNQWHIPKSKQSRANWNVKKNKRHRVRADENKDRCDSSNFNSSCYYYCCCSNKRFLKSEVPPSTSIENLLALFAIAFIFYCQVIIVKSMFDSYQVDLSSRNTFFIYISSVLSPLIMFSIIQYMMSMFVPRFLKILHFDEHNITKFLERFEKQCDEYKIIEKKRWIKLLRYCVRFIAEFMKIFSSYIDRSWKTFEKKSEKNIRIRTLSR